MPQLTVLDGATFCISDELGDIVERTHGLFADDTRFLSRLAVRIEDARPLLLSSRGVEYFSAAFFSKNAPTRNLRPDAIAIQHERFVGAGMQDHLLVTNVSGARVSFSVDVELAADFADIISVKEWDFALGDPEHASPLPEPIRGTRDDEGRFLFADRESGARTQIVLSQLGDETAGGVAFRLALAPRERWELRIDVVPVREGVPLAPPKLVERHFGEERRRVRGSLEAWDVSVPQLEASWDVLRHTFDRSVADLAALRMRGSGDRLGRLPAAGMPWFMTVFGRDTLITSLQTLLFGPELARGALRELAHLQAADDDPTRDAEPGKIIHEVRRGKCATRWFDRYYGTVDATPLFLVLLSETWRWSGDDDLVRELEAPARAALGWIDDSGDRDGDGFVEYERRTARGLENQSWKDSGDSQRFRDGRFAVAPIAPAEVQGYVFDAKRRTAELARTIWDDPALADRLERDADELCDRFDAAYWVSEGGYYALALDRDKARVDSLCSNMGHLLWSGIVRPDRAEAVAEALMSSELFSGWGVRTMSTADAAYSPLSYHNGTVWPHDTALCAWGLARAGRWEPAYRLVRALIEAASSFEYELPEVFAGFDRADAPFPVAYPTAARPQAWAAGTPVLLVRILLGLEADPVSRTLVSMAPGDASTYAGSASLHGLRAVGRRWRVQLDDSGVHVEAQSDLKENE